jgi:hypothetical protein
MLFTNTLSAAALPPIPENNWADRVLKVGSSLLNNWRTEGFWHVLWNQYADSIVFGPIIAGYPIMRRIADHSQLHRIEINILDMDNNDNDWEFPLIKVGVTSRRLVHAKFLRGDYLFVDRCMNNETQLHSWMINYGAEFIWPKYGTITGDVILNPLNLLKDYKNQKYQISLKLSILKPEVIDFFMGGRYLKYPDYHPWLSVTLFGFKAQLPIKTWNIKNYVRFGGGVNWDQPFRRKWMTRKNLHLSIYLQINVFKSSPHNSLRDYLWRPIDRSVTTHYHPDSVPDADKDAFRIYPALPTPRPQSPIQMERTDLGDLHKGVTPKPSTGSLHRPIGAHTLKHRVSMVSMVLSHTQQ